MTDLNKYKGLLETEKVRLEAELATVGRRNPSNPADWEAVPQATGQEPDPIDAGDLIEGYEDNAGILKELEARLQDVLASLKRIEAGTYGTCEVDGEAILAARLDANPAARTCVAHA